MDTNPGVYKFQYQIKTKDDAIRYFHKAIEENLKMNKNIIKEMAKRKDAIGRYLVENPTITTKSIRKRVQKNCCS